MQIVVEWELVQMFNRKKLIKFREANEYLGDKIEDLEKQLSDKTIEYLELKAEAKDPRNLLKNILNRDIKWIDVAGMDETQLAEWQANAKSALDNPVIKSLIGGIDDNGNLTNGEIVKNLIEYIARNSKDHGETRDLRMTINGAELIRQYLLEISSSEAKQEKAKDPHSTL